MNQPHVAAQFALLAHFQEDGRGQHQSCRGGVVVVGAAGGNPLLVIVEQVVGQLVQVPAVSRQQPLCNRIEDAVGIVLVQEPALGQQRDRLPVGDLERPSGGGAEGQ